jgi:Fe-S-cluster containining protein
VESDNDPDEFQRYVSFHRCQVYRATQEEKPDVMGVKLPLVCRHLNFDGNIGECSCAIYETRPKICQDFLCNAAKKED